MRHKGIITTLVCVLVVLSGIAAAAGIFSDGGPGTYPHETIRGGTVEIYGKGVYRHMPAEVAIQGIAQDWVTLLVGIPLLVLGLGWAWKGSLKGRLVLAGTLGYFLVTYLFYLMMAMYNALFLVYVVLLGASFFALALVLLSFDLDRLELGFGRKPPVGLAGGFLIVNSVNIGLLWLSVVVPPLLDGSLYPKDLGHSTTLVVQGLDLALLLPLSFLAGALLLARNRLGFLLGPVYLVFLCILMGALTAKVAAIGLGGGNIIPAVFLIPGTLLVGVAACVRLFGSLEG
ncbi:hypothetical protein [Anaerotalea alkaliphila]|uniref:Uncharacterized protein n=1 Tax=Anaerotalea alkaliphila TaxID=2662126 RepID=A0A7X5HUL7_9FIRM|nr:hypothetical protein [Anaerotalea alkaliphila]NDL66953.1 hypothetical protein [Anaerotalea alkaliphila]